MEERRDKWSHRYDGRPWGEACVPRRRAVAKRHGALITDARWGIVSVVLAPVAGVELLLLAAFSFVIK